MHAAADAINANVTTAAEATAMLDDPRFFGDPLQLPSLSPFESFFLLRAFGRVHGIGVVEDHERRMSAEFARNPFHVGGGLAGQGESRARRRRRRPGTRGASGSTSARLRTSLDMLIYAIYA